ncbi:TIGR02450 family Trp-rich protein [Pseudoalteromonas sp. MMG013]|uniref:TIGR02450 family Trp-rich protein n=1 Tax=Pseudoalteromonas sp. MMG013 TaxID=2822687 RepID=UPI001B36CB18|nr:TIGR02450 family Trp-rich protein [Pseudoalteromonas sp. MMG013]
MHKMNPRKLLNSKWTAISPQHKEKHFIVSEVEFDEEGRITLCIIEAVMTKRAIEVDWRTLKEGDMWKVGWR